jgi:phosphotransferase system  glucose/maltose/N-acetylglucosamine-specific IIC component
MEKKSLSTVLAMFLFTAAFIAAVKEAVTSVAYTASIQTDPFWVFFGGIVWGMVIATILLVAVLVWKEEI